MTIWRNAPDKGGMLWDALRADQCIALGWDDIPDFRAFSSRESLRAELSRREKGDGQGGAPRVWRFTNDVEIGDPVVANLGESIFLGLGYVSSDYLPPTDTDNPRRGKERLTHVRRVQWIDVERTQLPKRFFGVRPTSFRELEVDRFDELLDHLGRTPNGEDRIRRIARMREHSQRVSKLTASATSDAELRVDNDIVDSLEGERYLAWRASYHRDRRLRRSAIAGKRPLSCAACGFDFAAAYGEIGDGYAHVHHNVPLAERDGPTVTRLRDLRIVCANCHAMIHRFGECRTVDDIRRRIDAARRVSEGGGER